MRQKTLLSFIILLLAMVANAKVKINGIYYNFDTVSKQASVTSGGYSGSVTIPATVVYNDETYDVTSIERSAFSGYGGLTSVSIPNSIISIGNYAFNGCRSLTSLTIPENVKSIGSYAFCGCTGLASINIPEGVKSIGNNTFSECTSLTEITIPDGVTSIGQMAFYKCSNLSTIEIPSSVTFIDSDAFSDTPWYDNQPDGLIYVGNVAYCYKGTMPEDTAVTLQDGTLCISGGAFRQCTGMISIDIPNSVTTIGGLAFSGCTGLTEVTIPSGVTLIGYNACENCTKLAKVTINSNSILTANFDQSFSLEDYFGSQVAEYILGEEVTAIGDYAFNKCEGLKSVTIGSAVRTIGNYAFSDFPELKDFYCYATNVPIVSRNTFQDSYINYATLHVPNASIDAYKAAATWREFGKIVAIESEPGIEKCAMPVISMVDGSLNFSCETEGVKYICRLEFLTDGNNVKQPSRLIISVTAIKDGYVPSDAATKEIDASIIAGVRGDVNGDGVVNMPDAMFIVNKILNGKFPDEE